MPDENVTYTKEDLVKIINAAGSNLILKRKKISIESAIQNKLTEIEYKKEILSRFEKKAEELLVNCKAALEKSEFSGHLLANHTNIRDNVRKELDRMLEIEKKFALIGKRDEEIAVVIDTVEKLERRLLELRPKYNERIAEKERVETAIRQNQHSVDSLKESVTALSAKKEELSYLIPHYDGIDDLATKQFEAEGDIVEIKNRIDTIASELRTMESELPTLKERADVLKTEKATLNEKKASLEESISDIGELKDKASLVSDVNALNKRREAGKSDIAESLRLIGALKIDMSQIETSIDDEENFIGHFEEINKTLQTKKAELDEVVAELAKAEVKKEANQSVLEILLQITEYVKNINNALDTVTKEYRESYKSLVDTVAEGVM
ncbi:MAG: hypothetical protein HQK89_16650 [Nitrospirae bacterium]|nr:hypothetical protein [Nitrospirota bacterium]